MCVGWNCVKFIPLSCVDWGITPSDCCQMEWRQKAIASALRHHERTCSPMYSCYIHAAYHVQTSLHNAHQCAMLFAVMRLVIYDQFCKPQSSKAMHIWTIEKHQPQLELDWPERIAQKQGESTVQSSSPAFVSQTNNCNDCMFGAFHCLPHV